MAGPQMFENLGSTVYLAVLGCGYRPASRTGPERRAGTAARYMNAAETDFARISVSLKPFEYALEDIRHDGHLIVVKHVDEIPPNSLGVRGRSVGDRLAPVVGEFDYRPTRIVSARTSAEKSPPLHPGHQVRQPCPVPSEFATQVSGTKLPRRRLRQGHQHCKLRAGKAGVRDQLAVQDAFQTALEVQIQAPESLLIVVEPSPLRHCHSIAIVDAST